MGKRIMFRIVRGFVVYIIVSDILSGKAIARAIWMSNEISKFINKKILRKADEKDFKDARIVTVDFDTGKVISVE